MEHQNQLVALPTDNKGSFLEIQAITPKRLDTPSAGLQDHITGSVAPQEGPRRMPGFEGHQIPDDCIAILGEVQNKVQPFVQNCTTLPSNPHMANLHALIEALNLSKQTKDVSSLSQLKQFTYTSLTRVASSVCSRGLLHSLPALGISLNFHIVGAPG